MVTRYIRRTLLEITVLTVANAIYMIGVSNIVRSVKLWCHETRMRAEHSYRFGTCIDFKFKLGTVYRIETAKTLA